MAALAAYTVVFLVLLWRIVPDAATRISFAAGYNDAEYYVWVLTWVAHALATAPSRLFDANINYPAPEQLTGTEYFGTSQLVFAPLYGLTGNPVLATNAVMLVSYPLGAWLMARLLHALGVRRGAGWVGGLVFALGPGRVPANVIFFEYMNVYLPLVALALLRLRERPDTRRTVALGVALVLGLFSAYYMAVMLVYTSALWAVDELASPRPGRGRFALRATLASAVALGALVLASGPYLARTGTGAGLGPAMPAELTLGQFARFVGSSIVPKVGVVAVALAIAGLCGLRSGDARRCARLGMLCTIAGLGPMLLWPLLVPWVPAQLRFFRGAGKLFVVVGFGTALLGAAGIERLTKALGPATGRFLVGAALVSLVATRGVALSRFPIHTVLALSEHAATYDAVGVAARTAGGGALLELPLTGTLDRPDTAYPARLNSFEPDAMIGSTRHWLPLVSGYTAYQPPHRMLFLTTLGRLPAAEALDDLVDMTHVRFILLRPAAYWPSPDAREAIARMRGTRLLLAREGFDLLAVDRAPHHPGWFAAIASRPRRGETVLGTPLAALAPEAVAARVTASDLPTELAAGLPFLITVTAHNVGTTTWPVSAPFAIPLTSSFAYQRPDPSAPFVVALVAHWVPATGRDDDLPAPTRVALLRDVPAGESVTQALRLTTPATPGEYAFVLGVDQTGGAKFEEPASTPLRARIRVVSSAATGGGA